MSIDASSATWRQVEAYTTARLDEFRRLNDDTLTEQETSELRGRIAFAKQILALVKAKDKTKGTSADYGI